MATDDWYRNSTWDSSIETDFEARLKRSNRAYHKAQYLRIQASYLLESSDINVQLVGVKLINMITTQVCKTLTVTIKRHFTNEKHFDIFINFIYDNHFRTEKINRKNTTNSCLRETVISIRNGFLI